MGAVVKEGLMPGSLSAVPAERFQLTGIPCLAFGGVGAPYSSCRVGADLYGNTWDINYLLPLTLSHLLLLWQQSRNSMWVKTPKEIFVCVIVAWQQQHGGW